MNNFSLESFRNYGIDKNPEGIKSLRKKHASVLKQLDSDPLLTNQEFAPLPFNRATLIKRNSDSPIHTAQVLQGIGQQRLSIMPRRLRTRPKIPLLGGYLRYLSIYSTTTEFIISRWNFFIAMNLLFSGIVPFPNGTDIFKPAGDP